MVRNATGELIKQQLRPGFRNKPYFLPAGFASFPKRSKCDHPETTHYRYKAARQARKRLIGSKFVEAEKCTCGNYVLVTA